jgi:hypothetical protein
VLLSAPELLEVFPTPQSLRDTAVDNMLIDSDHYRDFYHGDGDYFEAVEELRGSGVYMRDEADLLPRAVAAVTGLSVRVLGEDGRPIGDALGLEGARQITLLRVNDGGGHYLGTGRVDGAAGGRGAVARHAPAPAPRGDGGAHGAPVSKAGSLASPSARAELREQAHVAPVDIEAQYDGVPDELVDAAREQVAVDIEVVDSDHGTTVFETRRMEVEPDRWVQETTLRVAIQDHDGGGLPDDVARAGFTRLRWGVDERFNGGYRLAGGDEFRLNIVHETNPALAHTTIRLGAHGNEPHELADHVGELLGLDGHLGTTDVDMQHLEFSHRDLADVPFDVDDIAGSEHLFEDDDLLGSPGERGPSIPLEEIDSVRPGAPVNRVRGPIEYDVRRMEVGLGRWVQEATIRLHMYDEHGVSTQGDLNRTFQDLLQGVEDRFNQAYLMPVGDQFRLNVVLVGDQADAHAVLGVDATDEQPWTLADRVGGLLGLPPHDGMTSDHLAELESRHGTLHDAPYVEDRDHGHSWQAGTDLLGRDRVFHAGEVTSKPLVDRQGRPFGTTFVQTRREQAHDAGWASGERRDRSMLFQTEVEDSSKIDHAGSLDVPTPWTADEAAVVAVHSNGAAARLQVMSIGDVQVSGRTLAHVAARTEGFREGIADGRRTTTLLACYSGAGPLGRGMHEALRQLDQADRVFAPTTKLMAVDLTATIRGGHTAVTTIDDGGHWNVFGETTPEHDSAVAHELATAARQDWIYGDHNAVGGARVPLADRKRTLALVRHIISAIEGDGRGLDPAARDLLGRLAQGHERPDIVSAAVHEYFEPDSGFDRAFPAVARPDAEGPWTTAVPKASADEHWPAPVDRDSDEEALGDEDDLFGPSEDEHEEGVSGPNTWALPWSSEPAAFARERSVLDVDEWHEQQRLQAMLGDHADGPWGSAERGGAWQRGPEEWRMALSNEHREMLFELARGEREQGREITNADVWRQVFRRSGIELNSREIDRFNNQFIEFTQHRLAVENDGKRSSVITMSAEHGAVDRDAVAARLTAGEAHPETVDLVVSMVNETVDNTRVAEGSAAADRLAAAVPKALRALECAGVIERYVREAGDVVTAGLMLNHVVDAVARTWVNEGEAPATALAETFGMKERERDVR